MRGVGEGPRAWGVRPTAKVRNPATALPIVVGIVDTREKFDAFLPVMDNPISGALATIEKVEIHWFRGNDKGSASRSE